MAAAEQSSLLQEIEKGKDLKHVSSTSDKSAPVIEKDVHVKEAPQKKVFEEIKTEHQLKHVETADKSQPVIDQSVKIHENPMKAVFAELPAGKAILTHNKVIDEVVNKPHELKHVSTFSDKSAPVIEKDVHVKEAPQKKVFEEIKTEHQLKHVETVDKSTPVIDKDAHIGENPMKAVFAELPAGKAILSHNKLVDEVVKPHELKHVETVDKSTPVIEKDAHIGEAPQKKVFAEITKPHELKHVDTVDKSTPVIDKSVHIGEAPQKKLFEEIKKSGSEAAGATPPTPSQ